MNGTIAENEEEMFDEMIGNFHVDYSGALSLDREDQGVLTSEDEYQHKSSLKPSISTSSNFSTETDRVAFHSQGQNFMLKKTFSGESDSSQQRVHTEVPGVQVEGNMSPNSTSDSPADSNDERVTGKRTSSHKGKEKGKTKVDATANTRARRYRERKKKQVEEIRHENKRLKQEREDFLAQIESLEQQVQTMQGEYVYKITEEENETMREELKSYSSYVAQIVQLASQPAPNLNVGSTTQTQNGTAVKPKIEPTVVPEHQEGTVAVSGVVSVEGPTVHSAQVKGLICQVIGLAHSSSTAYKETADTSSSSNSSSNSNSSEAKGDCANSNSGHWISHREVAVNKDTVANVQYQYLPLGAKDSAKRLNYRVDLTLPVGRDALFETLKGMTFSYEWLQGLAETYDLNQNEKVDTSVKVETVGNGSIHDKLESVFFEHRRGTYEHDYHGEIETVTTEQIMACTTNEIALDADAYSPLNGEVNESGNDGKKTVQARIIVTAGSGEIVRGPDNVSRLCFENSCFGGMIVRHDETKTKSIFTYIRSIPFSSKCMMCRGGMSEVVQNSVDNGETPDVVLEPVRHYLETLKI